MSSNQKLIQQLQERNKDRDRATDGGLHRRKPYLTMSIKEVEVAEEDLGFKLPDLLCDMLTQVANGGFGPQYGIPGFKWGACVDKWGLDGCYGKKLKLDRENSVWHWPRGLLPVAGYGCGMWACVDCEYQKQPMFLWDPNDLNEKLDGADARLNWGSSFWDQGLTLKTWLEGWLAEKPEPEPKWPSDAWMKKRLGFTLPKQS